MNGSKFEALIVDDDGTARRVVGYALTQEGFACHYAVDGEDALTRAKRQRFHLVVCDLKMPNKHGHAVAVELLRLSDPPLIVIHSSVDDPRLTKDLIVRGVHDIVHKPTNYETFAAKMWAMVYRTEKQRRGNVGKAEEYRAEHMTGKVSPSLEPESNDSKSGDSIEVKSLSDSQESGGVSATVDEANVEIPAPPPLVEQLESLAEDADTTITDIAKIVAANPSFSEMVLELSNATEYRRNRPRTSQVHEAILRLGVKKVTELAASLAEGEVPIGAS